MKRSITSHAAPFLVAANYPFSQQSWYQPGLSLSNVRDRLKLAYENASLYITSPIGGGTQVVIEIPIGEEENHENAHESIAFQI